MWQGFRIKITIFNGSVATCLMCNNVRNLNFLQTIMSIKKNIFANYVGQFYIALIGIFLVPVYVKYMGAEAYGLIGFYAMMQTWFFMLDMGLTPTIARETARFQGGGVDAIHLRQLFRLLEGVFLIVALIGAVSIIASSELIANEWLKVNELSTREVTNSLELMAVIIALRWMGGLYRSAITGFERLVWLNFFNVYIATFRFVFIVPILIYIDATPTTFFSYQLIVAILELVISYVMLYKLMPKVVIKNVIWNWEPLRASLKFSLSVAFTSLVWVIVTQSDKLLLSGLIPLADYAYFSMAVLLASGVMIISRPISGALLPRMTALNAEGNQLKLIQLYRNATQLVAIISIPSVLMLSFFSEHILYAWTEDAKIASEAALVLTLYALGNGIMVLTAFPYYLQYAQGQLKLHLIGNAIFVIFFIPFIYYLVITYGVVGAGYAWIISNLMFFLIYVPIVHYKFARGIHMKWLISDIGFIGALSLGFIVVINHFVKWPQDQYLLAANLLLVLACAIVIASMGSSKAREYLQRFVCNFGR